MSSRHKVEMRKGKEHYVFVFDDEHRSETLRQLGRFASNPQLSFTWYDAAVLSQQVRKTARKSNGGQELPKPMSSRFNVQG